MKALEAAEKRVFSGISAYLTGKFVPVKAGQCQTWTITAHQRKAAEDDAASRTPLVLLHGFGAGVGMWVQNLPDLSRDRYVHAIDLLGFGRSSRPAFSKDAEIVELEWVQSIEDWRREMKLDKFVLLGHSLGGFLASAYALQYPERVRHLVLVDPWGFGVRPPDNQLQVQIPAWVKVVARIVNVFNPFALLRVAGPFGQNMIKRMRPDLRAKFVDTVDDGDAIFDYIYHCNVQTPSGEIAFKTISEMFGWAKRPMIERFGTLHKDVPVTFIFGSRSWIDSGHGHRIKYEIRPQSYVHVETVRNAGHHVYADCAAEFNAFVNRVCDNVDRNRDRVDGVMPSSGASSSESVEEEIA